MLGDILVSVVSVSIIFFCWAFVIKISVEDGEPAYIPGAFALFGTIWITVTAIPLIQSLLR